MTAVHTQRAHRIALLIANPADRRLLEEMLRAVGYDVCHRLPCAPDIAGAVSMVLADEPMAAGCAVALGTLRSEAPETLVPALVLLPQSVDSTRWLASGFNDALRLPIKKTELLTRIEAFLALKERSEDALQENAERNRAILELAPDAVIVIDRKLCVIEFNGSAERIFGCARTQAIGADVCELIFPFAARASRRQQWLAYIADNAAPGERFEALALRQNGDEFPVEIGIARVAIRGQVQLTAFVQDLTQRKRGQAGLAHLAAIVEGANHAVVSKTLEGRITTWNKAAESLFGYTAEEAVGMSILKLLPPGYESEEEQIIDAVVRGSRFVALATKRCRKDGRIVDVTISVSPIRDAEGRVVGASKIARDITAEVEARERVRRLTRIHTVLSGINGLIVRVHNREELLRNACRIAVSAGEFRAAWVGWVNAKGLRIRPVACDGDAEFMRVVPLTFVETGPQGTSRLQRAIETKAPVVCNDVESDPQWGACGISGSIAILPLAATDVSVGILALYAGETGFFDEEEMGLLSELASDISFALDHIEKSERLDYLAYYDALTGLANRNLLHDRLRQAIAGAARRGDEVTIAFIDLDDFKLVNDSLGHSLGDELLKTIAARLQIALRETDTAARIGGDEFVLVLPRERDAARREPQASAASSVEEVVASLVQRLRTEVAKPIQLGEKEIRPTCSIGISIFPQDGSDTETLLRNADAAMYRAKELGRNNFQFFTQEMYERAHRRIDLQSRLKVALERGEFELHYQPQADLLTGGIVGVEALLRWNDPQRGLVGPNEFIAVAEETGLIVPIGEWVLNRACVQNKAWQDAGLPAIPVAVNISAKQCAQQDIDAVVASALRASGLAAEFLELELTESSSMAKPEKIVPLMQRLKQAGVKLSIDDFGTGYSSMSYLKRFPVDKLKLDMSFVHEITTDADSLAISEAIITMAHSLGLRVVAEGVETESQLALLAARGCNEVQGYLFSRPVPAHELAQLLAASKRLRAPLKTGMPELPALLVVDDDATVAKLVRGNLNCDEFDILLARDADEGFELLARYPVGVVLCDQRMPGLNGVQFLTRVRGMYPQTVRVLVSGYGDLSETREAINLGGVYKFLAKPWTRDELTGTIKQAFQQYRKGTRTPSSTISALRGPAL